MRLEITFESVFQNAELEQPREDQSVRQLVLGQLLGVSEHCRHLVERGETGGLEGRVRHR